MPQKTGIHIDLQVIFPSGLQLHQPVVNVHALGQRAVEVDDPLGIDAVPVPLAGRQVKEQCLALLGCGGCEVGAEPVVGVVPAERSVGIPFLPAVLRGNAGFPLVTRGTEFEPVQHHGGGLAQGIQLIADYPDFILLVVHKGPPWYIRARCPGFEIIAGL